MKKVRITAIRKACYPDLMEKYENPIQHACDVAEGQVWISMLLPQPIPSGIWKTLSISIMRVQQDMLR